MSKKKKLCGDFVEKNLFPQPAAAPSPSGIRVMAHTSGAGRGAAAPGRARALRGGGGATPEGEPARGPAPEGATILVVGLLLVARGLPVAAAARVTISNIEPRTTTAGATLPVHDGGVYHQPVNIVTVAKVRDDFLGNATSTLD